MAEQEQEPAQTIEDRTKDWLDANVGELRWQENEVGAMCEYARRRERFKSTLRLLGIGTAFKRWAVLRSNQRGNPQLVDWAFPASAFWLPSSLIFAVRVQLECPLVPMHSREVVPKMVPKPLIVIHRRTWLAVSVRALQSSSQRSPTGCARCGRRFPNRGGGDGDILSRQPSGIWQASLTRCELSDDPVRSTTPMRAPNGRTPAPPSRLSARNRVQDVVGSIVAIRHERAQNTFLLKSQLLKHASHRRITHIRGGLHPWVVIRE